MNPNEIVEYIDSKLIGNVVPLDVEVDAIQLIEEYAKSYCENEMKKFQETVDTHQAEKVDDFVIWAKDNVKKQAFENIEFWLAEWRYNKTTNI